MCACERRLPNNSQQLKLWLLTGMYQELVKVIRLRNWSLVQGVGTLSSGQTISIKHTHTPQAKSSGKCVSHFPSSRNRRQVDFKRTCATPGRDKFTGTVVGMVPSAALSLSTNIYLGVKCCLWILCLSSFHSTVKPHPLFGLGLREIGLCNHPDEGFKLNGTYRFESVTGKLFLSKSSNQQCIKLVDREGVTLIFF